MAKLISTVLDVVILGGITTMVISWVLGATLDVNLTGNARMVVFAVSILMYIVGILTKKLPPLPRIW